MGGCLVQLSSDKVPLTTDGRRCRTPQSDFVLRESKLQVSNQAALCETERKDCMNQKGQISPGEHSPPNHLRTTHISSQRLQQEAGNQPGSAPGPLQYFHCKFDVCARLLKVQAGVSLPLLPALEFLFHLLVCLVKPFHLVLFSPVFSCFAVFSQSLVFYRRGNEGR